MSRVDFYLSKEPSWKKDNKIWKKSNASKIRKGNVYFASCLSNLPINESFKFKRQLEDLSDAIECNGFVGVVPHRDTDPEKNLDASASLVYETDLQKILTSNLIVADLSYSSTGLGMELEIAKCNGIPVIAMCKVGSVVSRMALGSPALVAFIEYENEKDVKDKLGALLTNRDIN